MLKPFHLFAVAIFLLGGCSSDSTAGDSPDAAATTCAAGETMVCTCPDGNTTGEQLCDGNGEFGSCGPCDPAPVSFQSDVVPIFVASCGSGINGCHSREAYGANQGMDCRGWLSLENEALGSVYYAGNQVGESTGCPDTPLYDRLMTMAPWQCAPDSKYFAEGNLGGSYVMNKITGVDLCGLGNGDPSLAMPPADSGLSLSAADRSILERWILEGAKNN